MYPSVFHLQLLTRLLSFSNSIVPIRKDSHEFLADVFTFAYGAALLQNIDRIRPQLPEIWGDNQGR